MKIQSSLLLLLIILTTSCRGEEPKRMPDTLPDIRGSITTLQTSKDEKDHAYTTLVVESIEGISAEFPKASITAGENTLIETQDGAELTVEALQEGQSVQVWIDREIIDPSAVEAKAIAIKITENEPDEQPND